MSRASASPLGRAALAALAALGCAGPSAPGRATGGAGPGGSAARLAASGFDDWLKRGDAAGAARRFAEAVKLDPREPWARLGAAWAARRGLDDAAEASQLLGLVAGAPDHPLAGVAARRLGELAEAAPPLAAAVEAGLAPLLAGGRLRGMAALRARAAWAAAAEALGDGELSVRLRAGNGTVAAWTLVGPCGSYHALDFDRTFPPESGQLRCEPPPGIAAAEPRPLPFPEGTATLEGEPLGGDIYYLAADLQIGRGGRYLVVLGATVSMQAFLDGEPIAERRAFAGFPPTVQVVPRALEPGPHRVLLKLARGQARAAAAASFAREDGAPSDAAASAASGDRAVAPAPRPLVLPPALGSARWLAAALEPEAGPALSRLAAARDRGDGDREVAKALLAEAEAVLPGSAPLSAARGDALRDDPGLAERVARARAESAYDQALAKDAGDAETRLKRAELMRAGERLDDARALLAALPAAEARRPRGLVLQARLDWARGFAEGAERLAAEARRLGGHCQALDLLYEMATRRDAIARGDEFAEALAACPGGRERLAEHRRVRGDAAGAAAALEPLVRAAPARIELRFAYARALIARGEPRAAAEELASLSRLWPRDARIEKRRADALEMAGDAAGARQARERALLLDGSDLQLRRALALEDGKEPLGEYAEDGADALKAYQERRPSPRTSSAFVLDAAAVLFHPGGASTERVHQVIHVLDQRGVDQWGEVAIPAGAQVLQLRTLKPDGRTLEPEDLGDRSSVSLPGLEPGDYVEEEYIRSLPSRGPALPGFSAEPFYFQVGGSPLFRSRYVVAVPSGSGLAVDAHHMEAPAPSAEGDREVVRAERAEVPALVDEPSDPGPAEYLPFVQVGAGAGREELQRAAADAAVERTRPTLEVEAFAREAARAPAGAPPLAGEALLRAVYERVNAAIEGPGGPFAEPASQVLSRGRGSRTVLLKAACQALGLKARFALVKTFTSDPAPYRFPRPDLYSYPVVRVEAEGRTFWLDPATRFTPFGMLSQGARGAVALLLPEPGEAAEVARTPEDPAGDGREVVLKVALDARGDAALEAVERYLGYDGATAKAAMARLDAQTRRQAVEQALSRSFRGLSLESLAVEGEGRSGEPLVLRWKARVPQLARLEGGRGTIDAPLFPVRLGARYATLAARRTPLLVGASEPFSLRAEVALPAGMRPAGAGSRQVDGAFGRYRRSERAEGGVLVREDRFELNRARVSPEDYPAFAGFAKAVDEAQEAPMAFSE